MIDPLMCQSCVLEEKNTPLQGWNVGCQNNVLNKSHVPFTRDVNQEACIGLHVCNFTTFYFAIQRKYT